jgi:predicted DNA-binding transcriptional regulator AlpA
MRTYENAPDETFVRFSDAANMLGVSTQTIRKYETRPEMNFPDRVRYTKRFTGFLLGDLRQWMKTQRTG